MSSNLSYQSLKKSAQELLRRIHENHNQFKELIMKVDTSIHSEFIQLRKILIKDIRSIDKILQEMSELMDGFKMGLMKDSEKKFIEQSTIMVATVKEFYNSTKVQNKLEEDKSSKQSHQFREETRLQDDHSFQKEMKLKQENGRFVQGQQTKANELLSQQNQQLDQLDSSLDSLFHHSKEIHQELKIQTLMVNELDNEVTVASDKMTIVQSALTRLLRLIK